MHRAGYKISYRQWIYGARWGLDSMASRLFGDVVSKRAKSYYVEINGDTDLYEIQSHYHWSGRYTPKIWWRTIAPSA